MIALTLFLLFVLTGCLAVFKYRKTSLITFIITIFCFVAIGNGFLPSLLLKQLELPYTIPENLQWEKRNAIVVLGAGVVKIPEIDIMKPTLIAYSRIIEAVRLYLLCKKNGNSCTIIISGGDASHTGISEALAYKKEFLNLDVKNSDLILETQSMNTFENAKFTSELIKSEKFNKIILVTSSIHLKRALLYFSHFRITAVPFPSDYIAPLIFIAPIGYNFFLFDFAVHEYVGIMRFHIYNFFGWNTNSLGAGAL